VPPGRHKHRPIRGVSPVFLRVIDQILEHLGHRIGVKTHTRRGLDGEVEGQAHGLGPGEQLEGGLLDEGGEVAGGGLDHEGVAFEAGEAQDVADDAAEALRLQGDAAGVVAVVGGVPEALREHVGVHAEAGEGRP
jgi:hypothetical protein